MLLTSGQTRNSKERVMARPGGRHREEGDNGWPICRAPQRGGVAGGWPLRAPQRGGGRSRVPWPCACPGHASQGRGQGVRANLQPPLGRGTHLTASPRCREPMRCRPPAGGRHREEGDNGWPICRAPQRGGMAGPQEKAPVVGKWLAHSRAPHGWWCGLFKPDFELRTRRHVN